MCLSWNNDHWAFSPALCKGSAFFMYMNFYSSTAFLACIAIDRYLAVVYPLKFFFHKEVAKIVILCPSASRNFLSKFCKTWPSPRLPCLIVTGRSTLIRKARWLPPASRSRLQPPFCPPALSPPDCRSFLTGLLASFLDSCGLTVLEVHSFVLRKRWAADLRIYPEHIQG